MPSVKHDFTLKIMEIMNSHFAEQSEKVFNESELLQYLNIKTKAANRGSKSRSGFANHYAIFVLVEDYINRGFHDHGAMKNMRVRNFQHFFVGKESCRLAASFKITL
ncbi:MAG: hypothetical protein JXA81_06600 [Sedimentisphaerales bacterium]|nr:hypothetical protein [Sedimentisphaerales bacterium]